MFKRLRYRVGRWLLRPLAEQIIAHYKDQAKAHEACGDLVRAERCEYIGIGAYYVGVRRAAATRRPPLI